MERSERQRAGAIWASDLIRLLCLADRLEDAEQVYLAKLLSAAAETLMRRQVYLNDLSDEPRELVKALRGAEEILERNGLGYWLDGLKEGIRQMDKGQLAFIRGIPDPLICRRCGGLEERRRARLEETD